MNYHLMHVDYAAPLLAKFPKAITYADGTYHLTGEMPANYEGLIVPLNEQELTNEELTAKVDALISAPPTGKLVIASQEPGDWILANHPKFKQEPTEEI